jgi:hypothetical protein
MKRRVSICLSLLSVALGASCGTCNLQPVVTSISPTTVSAPGQSFVLVVNGDNFVPGSEVSWNDLFLSTKFVSSHELTAQVPASDLTSPGAVMVLVFNPAGSSTHVFGFTPGGGCGGFSNGITFTIT